MQHTCTTRTKNYAETGPTDADLSQGANCKHPADANPFSLVWTIEADDSQGLPGGQARTHPRLPARSPELPEAVVLHRVSVQGPQAPQPRERVTAQGGKWRRCGVYRSEDTGGKNPAALKSNLSLTGADRQ